MNPEYKAKWLAALRSGKYPQTQGALKRIINRKAQYCCLGVLCEIMVKDGLIEKSKRVSISDDVRSFGGMTGMLPMVVTDLVGMNKTERTEHYDPSWLADMNDMQGKSFTEIADWIEENL